MSVVSMSGKSSQHCVARRSAPQWNGVRPFSTTRTGATRTAHCRRTRSAPAVTTIRESADHGYDPTQLADDGRGGDRGGRSAARVCRAGRATRSRHVLLRKRRRSHPLRGDRLRLPVAADCGRRTELDDRRPHRQLAVQPDRGVQGRVPLHRLGPAQCQWRPVLRPARSRPAVGCLHRRPSRPDGSSGHRQVHGDGLLHRRPVHLEPAEARARPRSSPPCWRSRAARARRCATCSTTTT